MSNQPDIVILERAPSPIIAQMLVEALKSHGIQAYVDGAALMDPWALTQRALGQLGLDIQVHRDSLDEARDVLAAMREAGRMPEEEQEERGDENSGSRHP